MSICTRCSKIRENPKYQFCGNHDVRDDDIDAITDTNYLIKIIKNKNEFNDKDERATSAAFKDLSNHLSLSLYHEEEVLKRHNNLDECC